MVESQPPLNEFLNVTIEGRWAIRPVGMHTEHDLQHLYPLTDLP